MLTVEELVAVLKFQEIVGGRDDSAPIDLPLDYYSRSGEKRPVARFEVFQDPGTGEVLYTPKGLEYE